MFSHRRICGCTTVGRGLWGGRGRKKQEEHQQAPSEGLLAMKRKFLLARLGGVGTAAVVVMAEQVNLSDPQLGSVSVSILWG